MIIGGKSFLPSDTNQEKNHQIGILKVPEVKYDLSSTEALKGKRGITGDHSYTHCSLLRPYKHLFKQYNSQVQEEGKLEVIHANPNLTLQHTEFASRLDMTLLVHNTFNR